MIKLLSLGLWSCGQRSSMVQGACGQSMVQGTINLGPPRAEEQSESTTSPVPLSPSFEHTPRILLPRRVAPAADLAERKEAAIDHDHHPRAPPIDDLLALCQHIAASA